ncbi:hypothetical protein [Rhodopseudomonas sp. B29]|uniref:hypothetical protein n=1 Tax=Rhodopseudomonas sp. B29 TaxID=95607 RepID=UPI001AEC3DC7|nr:hypothetical protein [Rhodopseudomonas sp. B29]
MAAQRAGIASPLLSAEGFRRFERDVVRNLEFVRGPENGPEVLEVASESSVAEENIEGPSDAGDGFDDGGEGAWFVED